MNVIKHFNTIQTFTSKSFENTLSKIKGSNNIFLVELNGEKIQTEQEYLDLISTKFKFPSFGIDYKLGWAGYFDWICDLTWLEYDSIALVIYNYEDFINNDEVLKSKIIRDLSTEVLPWWETEVVQYVVEGKPKCFMVYLVD